MLSFNDDFSFRSLSRCVSLFVLTDDIVLLDDVICRRLLKAFPPRISVLLLDNIAGLPAVNIESPVCVYVCLWVFMCETKERK